MAMAGRFAERTPLVRDLTALAREELRHFEQVHALVRERGRALTRPGTDEYVKLLEQRTRRGGSAETALLDQLVRCGFIEARSCERFRLLATAPIEADLRRFYAELATAEARHHTLFFTHATAAVGEAAASSRIDEIARIEAAILNEIPPRARIH
jgi:tRNA-(ms[2]io[6]A)-hydroxylase